VRLIVLVIGWVLFVCSAEMNGANAAAPPSVAYQIAASALAYVAEGVNKGRAILLSIEARRTLVQAVLNGVDDALDRIPDSNGDGLRADKGLTNVKLPSVSDADKTAAATKKAVAAAVTLVKRLYGPFIMDSLVAVLAGSPRDLRHGGVALLPLGLVPGPKTTIHSARGNRDKGEALRSSQGLIRSAVSFFTTVYIGTPASATRPQQLRVCVLFASSASPTAS
jgi:hypothetical protein